MIQLSETGEQLLPSFMFEVTGFSPYLCVSSPFSSYDNNSINFGLRFICKLCPLFCFHTVSSCSPLYSPLYHLMLQHPLLSLPLFSVIDFPESWYSFSFQFLSSVVLHSWEPSKLFPTLLEKLLLLPFSSRSVFLVIYAWVVSQSNIMEFIESFSWMFPFPLLVLLLFSLVSYWIQLIFAPLSTYSSFP